MPPLNKSQKNGLALAISQLVCQGAQAATIVVSSDTDSLETSTGSNCTLGTAIESIDQQAVKHGCVNSGEAFGNNDYISHAPALNNQTITNGGRTA